MPRCMSESNCGGKPKSISDRTVGFLPDRISNCMPDAVSKKIDGGHFSIRKHQKNCDSTQTWLGFSKIQPQKRSKTGSFFFWRALLTFEVARLHVGCLLLVLAIGSCLLLAVFAIFGYYSLFVSCWLPADWKHFRSVLPENFTVPSPRILLKQSNARMLQRRQADTPELRHVLLWQNRRMKWSWHLPGMNRVRRFYDFFTFLYKIELYVKNAGSAVTI